MTTENHCGWTHYASMARAADRFDAGPSSYRARSGGPVRATRSEAITDECSRAHLNGPWVVETLAGELVGEDPLTGVWWTAEAATSYVETGQAAWAFSRSSIGLPVD